MTTLLFKAIVSKIDTCQDLLDAYQDYENDPNPDFCEHIGMVWEFLEIELYQLDILTIGL